jgi:phosphoglycolate phosphatase-like HAD superfamily hydrolase
MRLDAINAFTRRGLLVALLGLTLYATGVYARTETSDPLPSWNAGKVKQSITDFVTRVTKQGSSDFVKPELRIATIDNDGTLWVEQPLYTQFVFALDEVKALAPKHPDWKTTEPFKTVVSGNIDAIAGLSEKDMAEIVAVTHSGMSTDAFNETVANWLAIAKHPRFKRLYTDLVYQPMLELLAYLRANGFKTYIVSGGGQEFMRVFADKTYGVPPEQVVGSTDQTKYLGREPGPDQAAQNRLHR